MSIIRIHKEEKYSVIANSVLQDKRLSWEARGVMAYLLSKPNGWECRNYDLVNQGPASEYVIRRVIKELQDNGYINRYRKSDGRGTIEWVTEIYETPELNTAFRNGSFSNLEKFEMETFDLEKPAHIVSTDSNKYGLTVNNDLMAKPKNSNGDKPEAKALNNLADAIAKVCGNLDLNVISASTREELKRVTLSLYDKGIMPATLPVFESWWYDNSWQGKKGQAPTPKLIGDHWGQFEARDSNGTKIAQSPDGGFYL